MENHPSERTAPERDPEDDAWDRQIAEDVAAGRLDRFGDESPR